MMAKSFKINKCDKCIYVKEIKNGYVILCLYINYMLIVGSDDKSGLICQKYIEVYF